MTKKTQPKICLTASGILIQDDQALLVKHRKLGIWLCPGGHLDSGELPHQAAAREFFEETGLEVEPLPINVLKPTMESIYTPTPVACNLHWISEENYQRRLALKPPLSLWPKGCEQHFNQAFLVKPKSAKAMEIKLADKEVDGCSWFELKAIKTLKTRENIRSELILAFAVYKKYQRDKM